MPADSVLFEGDLSPGDKRVYVNNAINGKPLESDVLPALAQNNSKEQFANSPDLVEKILNAIMDALAAQGTISSQALHSSKLRGQMQNVLLGPGPLYEALRMRGAAKRPSQ